MNCEITTKIGVEITASEFAAFKEVQMSGAYNMYDPNARAMVGLSKEKWMAMMQYYDELEEQFVAAKLNPTSVEYKAPAKKMVEEDCVDCHGCGYYQPGAEDDDWTEVDCPECDGWGYIKESK